MYFHAGEEATILFAFWKISEIGGLLASMVVVFLMAFSYEALKFYREHLYRHSFQTVQYNTVSLPVENGACIKETHKTVQVKMFSWMHGWQTVLHVVQVVLSYFLMLIFMTYNIWLCLAVALGAGVGYFFVGWKKSMVVDITEHCH
jgi:copper transporter 1